MSNALGAGRPSRWCRPVFLSAMAIAISLTNEAWPQDAHRADSDPPVRAVLVSPDDVSRARLAEWRQDGLDVVLLIDEVDADVVEAARRVDDVLGGVDYLVDVARCPALATAHPEWMASIQGHHEWREAFPDLPQPADNEMVKVFPWVPVFNREPLQAQVERLQGILQELPGPRRLWLHHVQGAPSACGCGHPLCRWTADYGPIKTATPIGDAAPAEFVRKLSLAVGDVEIIPILTSECEAEDQHTVCGGVGCFEGACWKAFTRQLDQLAGEVRRVGVACFYKEFQRDLNRYPRPAGWVQFAIESFGKMPALRNGTGLKPNRLIAVLQGWDVSEAEMRQQVTVAESLKPAGILICHARLNESWQPKIVKIPPER